jgi:hypothetical protein
MAFEYFLINLIIFEKSPKYLKCWPLTPNKFFSARGIYRDFQIFIFYRKPKVFIKIWPCRSFVISNVLIDQRNIIHNSSLLGFMFTSGVDAYISHNTHLILIVEYFLKSWHYKLYLLRRQFCNLLLVEKVI